MKFPFILIALLLSSPALADVLWLTNGDRLTGQIEIEDPKIGMAVKGRVEVVRREMYDARYGMIFRAA